MPQKRTRLIAQVQHSIISALQTVGLSARPYLGELSVKEEPDIAKEEFPIVFVDFVGDEEDGIYRKLYFYLYFAHIAFGLAKTHRIGSSQELFEWLERSEKALLNIVDTPVVTRRSKKLFDGALSHGYLQIFMREVVAHTTQEDRWQ